MSYLVKAAQDLCKGGLDSVGLIGEAYAVEKLEMKPKLLAAQRERGVDMVTGRKKRVQVKTIRLRRGAFFGAIKDWSLIDECLFVGVNPDSYEVEYVWYTTAQKAREVIETQPDSYWRGKERASGHYLTAEKFVEHACIERREHV